MLKSISNLVRIVLREGPGGAVRFVKWRWYEKHMERWLGIDTGGDISTAELGIANPESRWYVATSYTTLATLFDSLHVKDQDVLVDFGLGKGRVSIFAGLYPFKKIVGVEISQELCSIANENRSRASVKLRCPFVYFSAQDATLFKIPPDMTIAYFANPFTGAILDKVMDNIHASVLANPRRVRIVCNDFSVDSAFSRQMHAYPWLKVEACIPLRAPGQVGQIYSVVG